jgi:hypothetical protein
MELKCGGLAKAITTERLVAPEEGTAKHLARASVGAIETYERRARQKAAALEWR